MITAEARTNCRILRKISICQPFLENAVEFPNACYKVTDSVCGLLCHAEKAMTNDTHCKTNDSDKTRNHDNDSHDSEQSVDNFRQDVQHFASPS